MDHVVYIDAKQGDLVKLLAGSKRMVIRGAMGRKLPYGRVTVGDRLFFVQNNGSCLVQACAEVASVENTAALTEEESGQAVAGHQDQLNLSPAQVKRWSGKRYLVFIGLSSVLQVNPFLIDRSEYGTMDDWLPVGDIERVKIQSS
jgi:hypothetical protein